VKQQKAKKPKEDERIGRSKLGRIIMIGKLMETIA
jgi:hypothetical protein